MRRLFPILLVAALAACTGPALRGDAAHSEVREITDLAAVGSTLAESRAPTLLVLDIDDTLLTADGFFGSDRWYEWQKTLPAGDPGKVPCLFDVIALNYEAATQVPTQPDAATLINGLAVDKLLLTSRNPLYRGGTLRTLRDAGFALPSPLGADGAGFSWEFRASPESPPVHVVYDQGLFMTSGQDKGKALLELLARAGLRYQRVLLVDDGPRNIENMRAALQAAGVAYVGLHYTRVPKTVSEDDARAGRASWQNWKTLLSRDYPARLAALERGQCAY